MSEDRIKNPKLAMVEALLFIHGEPLPFPKMESVLNLQKGEAEELSRELQARLEDDDRGLALIISADRVQMVTKPQFGGLLESFVKDQLSEDLSPAALETLAIISYFAPVSRAKIEYLRGVNSIFTLRSLLLRGLIERSPDPERSNSFLYAPSVELIKHFGLKDTRDLPEYEKFRALLSRLEKGDSSTQQESSESNPDKLQQNESDSSESVPDQPPIPEAEQ